MSADNYIGVISGGDGKYGVIPYGNMSLLGEDCMYRGRVEGNYFNTREEALVAAHDILQKEIYIVEYGVIELEPIPDKPCGRCFVCVHERKIISPDLERCDGCGAVISESEWKTLIRGKTYHGYCEPR